MPTSPSPSETPAGRAAEPSADDRRWQDVAGDVGRRVGIPVLLAILTLTALTAGVGLLVTEVLDAVDTFDHEVARDLVEGRTPRMDDITAVGAVPAHTITVAVLWVAAMAAGAWWTRSWEVPVFLLAAIGGEKLTYLFASMIVGRPRPPVPPLGHTFSTDAFPSGHVASAVSTYGGVAVVALWLDAGRRGRSRPLVVRALVGLAVAAIALFVAWSRTYRGHHFVSDVVAGALLGTLWVWLAWRIVLAPRHPPTTRTAAAGGSGDGGDPRTG